MNKELLKNCTVIIRSVGERTEGLSKYSILANGIKEDQIDYVKNISPFSKALREGYVRAIKVKRKYTFFIDADMIVLPGSLEFMLESMERLPNKTFFLNPLVYDYLCGSILPNGPHLYRTDMINEAKDLIDIEKITSRPETTVAKKMAKKGYDIIFLDYVSAAHEFEQYYCDIFSRGFNKYYKSKSNRGANLKYALNNKTKKDFQVLLEAYKEAERESYNLELRANQFKKSFDKLAVKEKEELLSSEFKKKYKELLDQLDYEKNFYSYKGYTGVLLDCKNKIKNTKKGILNKIKSKILK